MSESRSRVLVVDDDPLSRRILEQVLVSAGYEVETAVDGRDALAKLRHHRPDVVVTDWQMPVMDGLTLCRILKATEETRFTHVVMLSARGETESKVTGLETGADDYLVKPVEPIELAARVKVGLRLQRALSDLAAKNEILEKLALTDALTGLANRRAFGEALEAELARVRRHGRPASLLFLDLDHFKGVNDAHGHPVGDEVLAGFSQVLKRGSRRGDLAPPRGGAGLAPPPPAPPPGPAPPRGPPGPRGAGGGPAPPGAAGRSSPSAPRPRPGSLPPSWPRGSGGRPSGAPWAGRSPCP